MLPNNSITSNEKFVKKMIVALNTYQTKNQALYFRNNCQSYPISTKHNP
jgi:hypothetical protein